MNLCNFWRQQEIFIHQPLIFTDIFLQCLWVCVCAQLQHSLTKNPHSLPVLPHQSMVLQYCLGTSPSASHGRKGAEILWKMLTQIYPGSCQAQEPKKMNAGRTSRKCVDLPAPQWHRQWASGCLDICQEGCWASRNPGNAEGCCSMHSKPDALGCITLLLHVQRLFRAI